MVLTHDILEKVQLERQNSQWFPRSRGESTGYARDSMWVSVPLLTGFLVSPASTPFFLWCGEQELGWNGVNSVLICSAVDQSRPLTHMSRTLLLRHSPSQMVWTWKEGTWEITAILEFIKLCPTVVRIVIGTRITSRLIDHGTETRKGHVEHWIYRRCDTNEQWGDEISSPRNTHTQTP